ncbi:MAG: LysR family transcriptional regulator [Rhodobacteraceae bacterium]|nr:LysR family transcriptional regulator [Paracoccaceae bacterium]
MIKQERLAKCGDALRTFVAVADCRNITHAATALGRTQSAISVQIGKLEETLEVRLFERQARGMTLTADGEKLLPVARNIMSELSRVGALFEDPLRGRLRVGLPDDYAETLLETVLFDFSQRHPMVEVSARSGCTSGFPDEIRRGALDVAVVSHADIPGSAPLAPEPNLWASAPSFSCGPDRPAPLAVLERGNCSWRHFGADALETAGRAWRVAYISESFAGVRAAIRSGLAVGVLPKSLMEPALRELTESEGFPALPLTRRGILMSQHAPQEVAQAMVDAIRCATVGATP